MNRGIFVNNIDEKKKLPIPYKDDKYSKSNYLISAKYASSLLENKITAISLAKIQKKEYVEDKNGRIVCNMTANELRKLLNANAGSFYSQLEPIAINMTSRTIGFSDPSKNGGVFDYISVVDRARYENGVFSIFYNSDVKEYLSDFKANFTVLELPTMLKFKNVYSFRLYELLSSKSYYRKGIPKKLKTQIFKIEFNLSELKLNMGVVNAELDIVRKELNNKQNPNFDKAVEKSPEKKFNTWYEFKRGVLDVAIKEINNKTDMKVSFTPLKGGRGGKVYGVEFIVDLTGKNVEAIENVLEVKNEMSEDDKIDFVVEVKMLLREFTTKDIRVICEVAEYDLNKIKNAYEMLKAQDNVKNATGWMISCLRDGYEINNWNRENNYINNFKQRKYDYDKLEAELTKRSYDENDSAVEDFLKNQNVSRI